MSFAVRTDFKSTQAKDAYTKWYKAERALNESEDKAVKANKPCGYGHGNVELDAEYNRVADLEKEFLKIDNADETKTCGLKLGQNASNQANSSNPNLGKNLNLVA